MALPANLGRHCSDHSEPKWSPFTADQDTACAKLQAIADRDCPFFEALGEFLNAVLPGTSLFL